MKIQPLKTKSLNLKVTDKSMSTNLPKVKRNLKNYLDWVNHKEIGWVLDLIGTLHMTLTSPTHL